jgi:arylsulfatase A-like enzyme
MTDSATPKTEAKAVRPEFWAAFAYTTAAVFASSAFIKILLATERHGVEALIPGPRLTGWLLRDGIVAAVFGLIAATMVTIAAKRHVAAQRVFTGIAVFFAVYLGANVPFFRSFSTPLNRGMMGMAGGVGDLGESAAGLVTVANTWPLVAAIALTLLVPWAITKRPRVGTSILALVLGYTLILGSLGLDHIDPRGLNRNAVWELALLAIPEKTTTPEALGDDVRVSQPIPRGSMFEPGAVGLDLEALRGAAEDMNIIWVVMESTSAEYLGLYGASDDPAPNVSRIAETALVFDDYYTVTPASMKSLFANLCSTYPYPRPTAVTYIRPQIPCHSFPEVLKLNGYRSSLVHSGKFTYTRKIDFLEGRGFESLWDMRSLPQDDTMYTDSWGIEEEASVAQMTRFLDEVGDDKFFLMYMPIFPHYPYHLPPDETPKYGDDGSKEKYLSALAYADRNLGDLYDAVEARGLLDNTLFIIIGDHGEAFAQHPGNRIHSTSIYEENVHIPALLSNPRLFPQQQRMSVIADHTAMAPTLMDLLALPTPERWQGHSLLDGERHMARFFTDYSFLYLGLRDGPYKVIHQVQTGITQLYNIEEDPTERNDISADHEEMVDAYVAHLDHWYVRQLALFADYEGFVAGTLADSGKTLLQNLVPVDIDHGEKKSRFGTSISYRPLVIDGVAFDTGIGLHADSRVEYALTGEYTTFTGKVGRNEAARRGQALAEIWLDGVRVFESGPLERGTAAVPFEIVLTGASILEIKVLQSDDGLSGDHVDWVDATVD